MVCAFSCAFLAQAEDPYRSYNLDWNRPDEITVKVNQYDTAPIRIYTFQDGEAWSSLNWDGYMKWASSKSDMVLNGGVTVTGTSKTNYYEFVPGTNTFYKSFTEGKPGYLEIYFAKPIESKTTTIAQGGLVCNESPGKNANGKLAKTFSIVGDSYGPFTGDFSAWPFVQTNSFAGSYLRLVDFNTYSNYVDDTFQTIAGFNSWSNTVQAGLDVVDTAILWDGSRNFRADQSMGTNKLVDVKAISFLPTNSSVCITEGNVYWDEADSTLALRTDDTNVIMQVGQEFHIKAQKAAGDTILNGQILYQSGSQGDRTKVGLADDTTNNHVIGYATADFSSNDGYVTTEGLVRDVDTSAYTAGDELYPSLTPGAVTNVAPSANSQTIGHVVRSHATAGIIYAHIDSREVDPLALPLITALRADYATTSNTVDTLVTDVASLTTTTAVNTASIAVNTADISALRSDYATTSNLLNVTSNTLNTAIGAGDTATSNGLVAYVDSEIGTYSNYADTAFMDNFAGSYKVLFSDGSGNKSELSLGADGTVLTSTGPSASPTFSAPNLPIDARNFTNSLIPATSNVYDIASALFPARGLHFGSDGANSGLFWEETKRVGFSGYNFNVTGNGVFSGDLNTSSNLNVDGTSTLDSQTITNWSDVALYWSYHDVSNQVFVSKEGNDSNDGKSIEKPKLTIGSAISAYGSGRTDWLVINIGPGIYDEAVNLDNLIALRGSGMGTVVYQNSARVLACNTGDTNTISDLTLMISDPSSASENALYIDDADVIVDKCVIKISAQLTDGEARLVWIDGTDSAIVKSCVLDINDASPRSGGANTRNYIRVNGGGGSVSIEGCEFIGNLLDSNDDIDVISMVYVGQQTILNNVAELVPNSVSSATAKYKFVEVGSGPLEPYGTVIGNNVRFDGSLGTGGEAYFADFSDGPFLVAGNVFNAESGWTTRYGLTGGSAGSVYGDMVCLNVDAGTDPTATFTESVAFSNEKNEWFKYQNASGGFSYSSNGTFRIDGELETVSGGVTNVVNPDVHGMLYMDSPGHDQALTATYSVITNWTEYTNGTPAATENVIIDAIAGTMNPEVAGWIEIFVNFSYGTAASEDSEFAVFLDGVEQDHLEIARKTSVNDTGACSFSGRLYVPATTNILDVRTRVLDGSGTMTPEKCQFWIAED